MKRSLAKLIELRVMSQVEIYNSYAFGVIQTGGEFYCFTISGDSTFCAFEICKGSLVFSLTLRIVQLRTYSIDPASRPCAVTFAKLTFTIGFSGRPLAEKICPAFTISTFSIRMLRNSQKPRSGGSTFVLKAIQCGGTLAASFGMIA